MFFIDTALLDLTERVCRRFQVLTGRTNVWLALQLTNLSIVVYFVWAAMSFWDTAIGPRIAVGVFCGVVLYALTQTVLKDPIEAFEASAYQRAAKGYRNPRRLRDASLRIAFLTLSITLLWPIAVTYGNPRLRAALLGYALIVLTTTVLYLLACDPLPPCAGLVWERLRRLALARRVARSEPAAPGSSRLACRQRQAWTVM